MSDPSEMTQTVQDAPTELVPGMTPVAEETTSIRPATGRMDQFDVVIRGYDRRQVDDYLAQLGGYVAQLRADSDAAAEREATTANELTRVRTELERGRPGFDALGERVTQMLALAEQEAEQMRGAAQADSLEVRAAAERAAAQMRSDAKRDSDELAESTRRELAELERRRADLLADLADIRQELDRLLAGPTRRIDLTERSAVAEPASVDEVDEVEEEAATPGSA